jgi:hypothetical protein
MVRRFQCVVREALHADAGEKSHGAALGFFFTNTFNRIGFFLQIAPCLVPTPVADGVKPQIR